LACLFVKQIVYDIFRKGFIRLLKLFQAAGLQAARQHREEEHANSIDKDNNNKMLHKGEKKIEEEEEEEMDTNKTVKIIEELADRITEELQNQLEEDGLDYEEEDSDSEGD
jgi:hypothetical protein